MGVVRLSRIHATNEARLSILIGDPYQGIGLGGELVRRAVDVARSEHMKRINAILPGPTDTPLARANADTWLGFGTDYRADAGIEASTPEEQGYPLVFLCSDAASYVNGQTLAVDGGFDAAGIGLPSLRRARHK